MGLSGDTKEKPLRLIAELLERENVPYALVGGMAVRLHTREPRNTRDINLAVPAYADIPRDALVRAGFEHTGRHAHSDNWLAPGSGSHKERTPVQFSAEEAALIGAIERARVIDVGGVRLSLVTASDLIVLKLAAAEEPTRRPSKREHDVGDIVALIEEHPDTTSVVPELAERLQRIRART